MTRNHRRASAEVPPPGEPASLLMAEEALRAELERLTGALGEAWVGGSRRPRDNDHCHTTARLDEVGAEHQQALTKSLEKYSGELGPRKLILLLMSLWRECSALWDESLSYRTLTVVEATTIGFVGVAAERGTGWERSALRVLGQAMTLIKADADVFKQINLPSADGLEQAARGSAGVAGQAMSQVRSVLAELDPWSGEPGDDADRIAEGLREIESVAYQNQVFYRALVPAARAVADFEKWLAEAPRLGSAPPAGAVADPRSRGELLAGLAAAIDGVGQAQASLRLISDLASLRELILRDQFSGPALKDLREWLSADVRGDLDELIAAGRVRELSDLRQRIPGLSLEELAARLSVRELAARPSLRELVNAGASGDLILSRCEPWEWLLMELREVVTSGHRGAPRQVFVPRRVSIRYCYPFAIEAAEQHRPSEDALRERLGPVFQRLGLAVLEARDLAPTEFFTRDAGLYGGWRISLPDLEFGYEPPPGADGGGRTGRCRAWIDLSNMGNHCLCIEPRMLEAPLPNHLYRALHAGTPFALGARVFVAGQTAGEVPAGWDNLHLFSRDVIEAVARADLWTGKERLPLGERFVRGNLHAIVVVRTDGSLGTRQGTIADNLDRALGSGILFRSIQRAATTLAEWVRYPPVPLPGAQGPATIGTPEMGLAGDWCAFTGETTVFGIIAAPSWHSDVYVEAAQFASSWSPQLQLWNRRLEKTIQSLEPAASGKQPGAGREQEAKRLRKVERRVRLHLAQIRTEELTATLAHRRFLDQLLDMTTLSRLHEELDAQLEAAERLTDWFDEYAHQESDRRRQVLLAAIALFGLFEVGTFLSIANTDGLFAVTARKGLWEVWLMVAVFVLGLFVGVYLFSERASAWLNHRWRKAVRIIRPGRQAGDEEVVPGE